jgi:thymidylate synthase ThyX
VKYKDGTYYGWGTSRHGDINVAVVIESGRIGISYLEKSSRYVPFDDKVNLSVFGVDVELFFAAGSDRSLVLGRFTHHAEHFARSSKIETALRHDITDGCQHVVRAVDVGIQR